MSESSVNNIKKLDHHIQLDLCRTRPLYRQGKKLTAIKVYTVNDESQHIIISGVPKLKLIDDVRKIIIPYGVIKELVVINDYPDEDFTESYHVRYERIQSARIAKRFLDGKNFFGGILHVFYAPELESVVETRKKLIQRRRDISVRIKRQKEEAANLKIDVFEARPQYNRQKKYPALPLTEERLNKHYPSESMTSIYNGIPRNIDPRPVCEPSLPSPHELHLQSSSKNYKGRNIDDSVKVRVERPKLIDTKKLSQFNDSIKDVKIFSAVKKVDKGITIKLLPNTQGTKKRIIMKDSNVTSLLPSDDLQTSIASAKARIREAMEKN
ncbi:RNA-binding protein 48 [Microplitis mediator]|uniref:RNA-binding protein 48 n=1 Tax=Microplitis mediator TaxID=375433 RepID=UPI002553BB5C|nr:RNA-binding protein 48 [Microplitis mediator]